MRIVTGKLVPGCTAGPSTLAKICVFAFQNSDRIVLRFKNTGVIVASCFIWIQTRVCVCVFFKVLAVLFCFVLKSCSKVQHSYS